MSDINVRVVSQDATQVKLGTQNAIKVLSSSSGGAGTLGGLADIDISGGLAKWNTAIHTPRPLIG